MCGIAAIFSLKGKEDLSPIHKMTDLIKHRGPDGNGIFLDETLALGHRRLAILDLTDAGAQPMHDDHLSITYNGEIYNYLEIRAELGGQFKTETDTEVILKAYEVYGIQFLEKLNGMFAFVLVDRKRGKAYAVRDRFGVKPLYMHENRTLAFASEIKQFQALPSFKALLNHQRAYDFLNFGVFDHTEETLFQGVQQIRGGHYAEIDLKKGSYAIKRWYQLPKAKSSISYEEAVTECRRLLQEAVRIRLRSDVEVGSCLSGGIDSSSIVCIAGNSIKTFSARSEDPKIDEFAFMESVRSHAGSQAFYVTPQKSGLEDSLDELLWHQDEPFGSTSIFAQWSLFQKVKEEGIKVMLDGQGADEQLGGYYEFYGIYLKELLQKGEIRELSKELMSGSPMRPFRSLAKQFIPKKIKDHLLYRMNKPSIKCPWLDFNVLKAEQIHPFKGKGSFKDYAEEMLLYSNLPMLLHYEDRNSMAHSVESRTPFLDYRLVEFIAGLPASFLIKHGTTKRLLRDAMHGIVPECVLKRKDKIAFATDERAWLQDLELEEVELFRPEIIPKIENILQGKEPFSFLPFRVIAFTKWLKRFNVSVQPDI